MAIGLNYRTAPVEVRERFWIGETRRYPALAELARAEAIEEIVILATCNRTEFYLWTSDVTLAVNSVLRFLTAEYGLKLCEWKHFYRLMDEAAFEQKLDKQLGVFFVPRARGAGFARMGNGALQFSSACLAPG